MQVMMLVRLEWWQVRVEKKLTIFLRQKTQGLIDIPELKKSEKKESRVT